VPLETVFLDAGGVLVFPNWRRVSETLARHGVRVDADTLARAEPHARRRLDDQQVVGATTDTSRGWLFFDLILAHAGIPKSDRTAAALEELHVYHQAQNLWELVPANVVPTLSALKSRGLTLVVVSNANGTLLQHMDRLDLARWFDCVIDSCDVQVEKPDPRIFQIAMARVNATPETTIHVGDIYHVDVIGARNAGIRPVLLDEAGLYDDVDCLRIRSLPELPDLIGDL
jgi:HAD superfamily hydrolase (TIGR01509 family)